MSHPVHFLLLMLAEYTSTQPCYYSPLLDPSPARNYPVWDEGHAGTEKAAGGEGAYYEEQDKMDTLFGAWNE